MAPKKLADSVWSPQMGWGRTSPSVSRVIKPLDVAGIEAAVMSGSAVIARGLGRSYGDAAQNAGGAVLDLATLNSIVWGEAGIVTVGAGLCLRDLINDAVPRGWFVPVTPGTSWVTIGGAIAADVHGKNHHRDGSFGAHVLRIGIVDGRGDRIDLTPSDERFWATVGGMGLTGIIIDATVQMIPIPGRHMTVSTRRTADFDSTVEALMSADSARYSVAWLDSLATGAACGRGIVTFGEHSSDAGAGKGDAVAAPRISAPEIFPDQLLNRRTVAAFNSLWFRLAPSHRDGQRQSLTEFFHPLDAVAHWNRVYGTRGFLQYQCVVPAGELEILRRIFTRFVDAQVPSFLTVLKRFGAASNAPLSFPIPGWTLTLDIPTDVPGLPAILAAADDLVTHAGGRLYLAKDSRMPARLMPLMYPRLGQWQAIRDAMDPSGVFTSDLGSRLGLLRPGRG